jgi:hypothetical protein
LHRQNDDGRLNRNVSVDFRVCLRPF